MITTNLTLNGKDVPDLYPLPIGSMAPYFSGIDQYGDSYSLETLKEKGTSVLFFYSGYWCNYCAKKLQNFQNDLRELADIGVNIAVVTLNGEEFTNKSLKGSNLKVPVLIDFNHTIMKSYKVAFESNTLMKYADEIGINNEHISNMAESDFLPIPATYIINSKGTIDHVHFTPNHISPMTAEDVKQYLKI